MKRIPPNRPIPPVHPKIAEIKPERLGVAPHSMAKATDTITDSEDIVTLAKPGDYYQVMKNIGQAHHMFSRFLNLRIIFHKIFFVLFFLKVEIFYWDQKC